MARSFGAQVLPDVSHWVSSGAWGGSFRGVMLSGSLRVFAPCHHAPSTINRACAPVATVLSVSVPVGFRDRMVFTLGAATRCGATAATTP